MINFSYGDIVLFNFYSIILIMNESHQQEGKELDSRSGDSTDVPGNDENTFEGLDVGDKTEELSPTPRTENAGPGTEFDLPDSMAETPTLAVLMLQKSFVHHSILRILKDAGSPMKGVEIQKRIGVGTEGIAAGLRRLFFAGFIELNPHSHVLGYLITESGREYFKTLDRTLG